MKQTSDQQFIEVAAKTALGAENQPERIAVARHGTRIKHQEIGGYLLECVHHCPLARHPPGKLVQFQLGKGLHRGDD